MGNPYQELWPILVAAIIHTLLGAVLIAYVMKSTNSIITSLRVQSTLGKDKTLIAFIVIDSLFVILWLYLISDLTIETLTLLNIL